MTKETSFDKLKRALIDIKNYYPDGIVYGKLEFYFEGKKHVLDLLIDQEIFELIPKNQVKKLPIEEEERGKRWYRLTKRGIDLAISMINLEHSERMKEYTEKTLNYSKEINKFTEIILYVGIGALGMAILHLVVALLIAVNI